MLAFYVGSVVNWCFDFGQDVESIDHLLHCDTMLSAVCFSLRGAVVKLSVFHFLSLVMKWQKLQCETPCDTDGT